MIRLLRILGFLMIVTGAIVLITWLIKPLRMVWPWLMALPLPIKIGIGVAATGFLLLLSTLIWERWSEREHDRSLLDD
jgi:hypothetical protein